MVKKALILTAYNRPGYFTSTLESWRKVRGLAGWSIIIRIEPSPVQDEIVAIAERFRDDIGLPVEILVNPVCYGVLLHPYVAFSVALVGEEQFDFVVRAEDDLEVSDDILEYFTWAEAEFRNDPQVASIHANQMALGTDPRVVAKEASFDPWVWGTWRDRWTYILAPDWDMDYSTFNGTPMNESGWDWNFKTRVYPKHDLRGVFPETSRVRNIGIVGVHAYPEIYATAGTYQPEYGKLNYVHIR